MQKWGECKYCHQHRMIEVGEDCSQAEIDEAATYSCDCEAATTAAQMKDQLTYAEAIMIQKHTPESIRNFLLAGVKLIQNSVLRKISAYDTNRKYELSINASGKIVIRIIDTEKLEQKV